jgi:Transcriptional regulator
MTPQLMKTFLKVAEVKSFSIAAEQLHLTQSAVSKRIALFENEFEYSLFNRVGRSIQLTQAGEIIAKKCHDILKINEQMHEEVAALYEQPIGQINIATSHHIGLYRLPNILQSFASQYPDITLNMNFTDSEVAYQDIISGEADIAIATLPMQESHSNAAKQIKHIHYWTDNLIIVCHENHPLKKLDNVSIKDLAKHPAILPGFQTFTRRIIHEIFESHQVDITIAFSTNYLETIKHMVRAGLGWSVLPEIMLDHHLSTISVANFSAQRHLGIMFNSTIKPSFAQRLFVQHLDNNHKL